MEAAAAAGLHPRLDDAVPPQALATTLRRRKCSHSGTRGSASATGSVYGYPGTNASTLAYQLPYAKSTSSEPSQASVYLPPGPQASGASAPGTAGDLNSGSPAAGSNNAGDSPGVCPLQSVVTLTTQYTVTVTQNGPAAAATAFATIAGATAPLQTGSISNGSNGPGSIAQNGSGNNSNSSGSMLGNGSAASGSTSNGSNGPGSVAQNGSGNNSNSSGSTLENGSAATGSIGPKRTKCRKPNAPSIAVASASAGTGGLFGNGTSGYLHYPVAANTSSSSGPSTSSNATGSHTGVNTTLTMNHTSDANLNGEFWAGGIYISLLLWTNL